MKRQISAAAVVLLSAAVGMIACGKTSTSNPSAPSAINPAAVTANADGSTLKVTAPTLVSPVNGVKLQQGDPVILKINNSTPLYVPSLTLAYRFEVSAAGAGVVQSTIVAGGAGQTSLQIDDGLLDGEKTYQWRARAEYQGIAGPWSGVQSFVAPPNTGYIKGHELYDPLINGTTVGTIHGPVTFIPGQGVRLDSVNSYIEYELPEQLTAGEYSLLATNISVISATEEPKLRVMSMREGGAAINDNEYRMTVEKRGNGAIAWRFITGNNGPGGYIETVGAERVTHAFHESMDYFIRASWTGTDGFFRVQMREGGFDGDEFYNFGKSYHSVYQPWPHMIYIGSPWVPGDRGEPSSLEDEIVRQVWVSDRERPAYANK